MSITISLISWVNNTHIDLTRNITFQNTVLLTAVLIFFFAIGNIFLKINLTKLNSILTTRLKWKRDKENIKRLALITGIYYINFKESIQKLPTIFTVVVSLLLIPIISLITAIYASKLSGNSIIPLIIFCILMVVYSVNISYKIIAIRDIIDNYEKSNKKKNKKIGGHFY